MSTSWNLTPFQILFLFPLLFFTENLPSPHVKNKTPEKKLYPREIIGILQVMST